MTDFRGTKNFLDGGVPTDGYDLINNRTDGVDAILAKDINDLADSVVTTQKTLADGYAITTIFPRSTSSGLSWQDGEALVYSGSLNKMINGASGDSSLKIQSITNPNAVVKKGNLILTNGKELNIASDLSVNLTTAAGGGSPADGYYYLYVDLNALPAQTTIAGRKIYAITAAMFRATTTVPESNNLSRYVPIGVVNRSGASWSSSNFATLAIRRHDLPNISVSPVVYTGSLGFSASIQSIAHNTNTPVASQIWTAQVTRNSDGYQLQLDNSYIVRQTINTLFVDLSFLAASDTVFFTLQNAAISAQTLPSKTYDSGVVAANTLTFPISHGLGSVPTTIVLQHQIASGEFENLDPSTLISATNTQIKNDATWTSILGSDNVRVVASLGADGNAISLGSVGSDIIPSADNTFSLGTTALRWNDLHLGPTSLQVHGDTTDTKKISIQYVTSDAYFTTDATSGMRWKSGSTDTGSVSNAGAWTFGASGGSQAHTVNGNALSLIGAGSADLVIASVAAGVSTLAFKDGATVRARIRTSGSSILQFRNAADAQSNGEVTDAGAWTLGPVAGIGNSTHTTYGSLTFGGTSAAIGHADEIDAGANYYLNFTGTGKAIGTATGYSIFSTIRRTVSTANAFQWSTNYQDAQTAGSSVVTTNNRTVGSITAAGKWTLGEAGGSQAHLINGSLGMGSSSIAGVSNISANQSGISINDKSTSDFAFGGGAGGIFIISNTSNSFTAMFFVSGTSVVEVSDPTSNFSTTPGTVGTNVYNSGVNGTVRVENKTGSGARSYRILWLATN